MYVEEQKGTLENTKDSPVASKKKTKTQHTFSFLGRSQRTVCVHICGQSITRRKENRNGGVVDEEEGQNAGDGHSGAFR